MRSEISKAIERCRFRIDRSLDCNIADILLLIEEIENKDNPRSSNDKDDKEDRVW
jgi:hypothetical protein